MDGSICYLSGDHSTVWPTENRLKVNNYDIKSNWCKKVNKKTHKKIYSQVLFILSSLFMLESFTFDQFFWVTLYYYSPLFGQSSPIHNSTQILFAYYSLYHLLKRRNAEWKTVEQTCMADHTSTLFFSYLYL